MEFSRNQIGIAAGTGVLVLLIFFGYLLHLNGQGPVLDHGLAQRLGIPRDEAAKFIRGMRDGNCKEALANWEKDYRRKYAAFICDSESRHPLISWEVADWEDSSPLRILRYRGKRRNAPDQKGTYKELFSVTLENKGGQWVVTKYDSMY